MKPATKYRDDWLSVIYDATGDYVKSKRAMELAELNGLFDPVDSPAQGPPNRHTVIETAIRSYCRRQSSAAVEDGRIYYAGLSITDLVNDIEAALSVTSTDRGGAV